MNAYPHMSTRGWRSHGGTWVTAAALAATALSLGTLLGAAPVLAEDTDDTPIATSLIAGNYFRRDLADSKYTVMATFINRATPDSGDVPAGGMAVFGWFESGEVQLLHWVEYLPSMQQMTAQRIVKPAKFPLDPKATPLYTMVCGWPLDDQRVPGKITAAYTERDDANTRVKESSVGTLLNVRWVPVPASRAARHFQAKDYCAEVATTKKSSAPLWLITTTE
ncbi:hypothetical protein PS918_02139 [Pseudomonas fluorescens]|uniref:Uncharacterized protein n=1 Tax=Pseudomonas fluorescens TaxID=294 RepID=A0A5E7RZT4_PSEFL|nr:hypothetical protein [Pseudomonas fluorescens]VVP79365.1 hypothetical protein PS918_02139 [Pseudomonas fluorescens]